MNYYVVTEGRDKITLFLVDRNKTKKHWWTMSLTKAMAFHSESAAETVISRLKYKNPRVVNHTEAIRLEHENDYNCAIIEEHPFSSEALGQE